MFARKRVKGRNFSYEFGRLSKGIQEKLDEAIQKVLMEESNNEYYSLQVELLEHSRSIKSQAMTIILKKLPDGKDLESLQVLSSMINSIDKLELDFKESLKSSGSLDKKLKLIQDIYTESNALLSFIKH